MQANIIKQSLFHHPRGGRPCAIDRHGRHFDLIILVFLELSDSVESSTSVRRHHFAGLGALGPPTYLISGNDAILRFFKRRLPAYDNGTGRRSLQADILRRISWDIGERHASDFLRESTFSVGIESRHPKGVVAELPQLRHVILHYVLHQHRLGGGGKVTLKDICKVQCKQLSVNGVIYCSVEHCCYAH